MDDIRQRLNRLEACDPASARRIRRALPDAAQDRPADLLSRSEAALRIAAWIDAHKADKPDLVFFPSPPCAEALASLMAAIPATCTVVILERDPLRAATLFGEYPLEPLIEQRRILLSVGQALSRIHNALFEVLDLPACPSILICDAFADACPEWPAYADMLTEIRKRFRMTLLNLATLMFQGARWHNNTLRNLPHFLTNPGVNALTDLFPGRPCIVAAAGPSLSEAIPYIREASDRFVIVAVGTALAPLRKAGIRPDLVVAVDGSPNIRKQFNTTCEDVFLVGSAFACPSIIPIVRGTFFGVTASDTIAHWVSGLGYQRGSLAAGGTVSASALDVAVRMGCNPIVSVGLDLCYARDGATHADFTSYHGEKRNGPDLLTVPGNFRPSVKTCVQFSSYIVAIGSYVQKHPEHDFINANSDGALIAGMELVRPASIGMLAARPHDAYSDIARAHTRNAGNDPLPPALEILTKARDDIDRITSLARRGASLCNCTMVRMKHAGLATADEIRQDLAAMQEIETEIMGDAGTSSLTAMVLRPVYFSAGRPMDADGRMESSPIAANRRSRFLFEQTAAACLRTRRLLSDVCDELALRRQEADRQSPTPCPT
jgi:hypothetical protein